jgi:hypothetical protein
MLVLGALTTGFLPLSLTRSTAAPDEDDVSLSTPASRRAVERALDWLVAHQLENGSWGSDVGFKLNDDYKVEQNDKPHVGVTALAGTAFLAAGSFPERGPYAKNVKKALEFVLASQDSNSGFISAHGTRMYSHAFATLFLAEVFGTTPDPRVRVALQRAVEFTYKSQNSQGGWRYVPNAEDSDMSITVCQVVALRAAKNKGIRVPKESIDAAVDYVLNSAVTNESQWPFQKGAFLYQYRPNNDSAAQQTRTSYALTAAGLTTLYGAGLYNDAQIRRFLEERKLEEYPKGRATPSFDVMLNYVERHYDDVYPRYKGHYFYFYGNYYATQAMFIAGGRYWERFYPRLRDDLVKDQRTDGSWFSNVAYAPAGGRPEWPVSTAIGAMLLQVPNHYLPIFQR